MEKIENRQGKEVTDENVKKVKEGRGEKKF